MRKARALSLILSRGSAAARTASGAAAAAGAGGRRVREGVKPFDRSALDRAAAPINAAHDAGSRANGDDAGEPARGEGSGGDGMGGDGGGDGLDRAFRKWRMAASFLNLDQLKAQFVRATSDMEEMAERLRLRELALEEEAKRKEAVRQRQQEALATRRSSSGGTAVQAQFQSAVTRLMLGMAASEAPGVPTSLRP
jgi:hypothetical protein